VETNVTTSDLDLDSGGNRLRAHLALPPDAPAPGLVVCHGFPVGKQRASSSGQTYPELADELAREAGWAVLTFNFRGTGGSGGDFSLAGWLADVHAAADHLRQRREVDGVWLAGASTGGSLAICAAAEDPRIHGVVTLASRSDFADWAVEPERFLAHAREIGVISTPDFPADQEEWCRELREIRPVEVVAKLPPRPLLLIHGDDDDVVPPEDARELADAYGEGAELRIVKGAGHRLRHDPRGVAVLLGWLDRQRSGASG
jgi:putative redox protein